MTANRLSVLLFFLEELKGQDTKADNTKEAKDGTHECLRRLTTAGKNGAVVMKTAEHDIPVYGLL